MSLLLLQACSWFTGGDPTGTLLAIQEVDGVARTVAIDVATGERRRITGVPDSAFPAPADPLGTHVLLVEASGGEGDHIERLLLVPLGGGDAVQLAPSAEMIRHPSFSPDGAFVVFESSAASFRDLYRVQRDGSGLVRLTDAPGGSFEPRVSPDGQRIVFASSRDGNAEIYTMNADGSDPVRLTDARQDDTRPGWLPDGRIAWIHQMGSSKVVWRMDADGGHQHVVRRQTTPALDHDWAVSPDGRTMAIATQGSPREIDVLLIDLESKEQVLLGGSGVDEMPVFSPDSEWVAWSGNGNGDPELWVARRDGSHARVVSPRPGPDWLPRWLPDPRSTP